MQFDTVQAVPRAVVMASLGYRGHHKADSQTNAAVEAAIDEIQRAARPRWGYGRYRLDEALCLEDSDTVLEGQSIRAHLHGCTACILLAVTLSQQADRLISTAQAVDMQRAVLLDVAASALVEQYADVAEQELRRAAGQEGLFLTGRFSPGYGDFSLDIQGRVLGLLDAQRAIGLTVSAAGILLPRKSITAVLGVAAHPVQGVLAGCESCALNGKCRAQKEGDYCAKQNS